MPRLALSLLGPFQAVVDEHVVTGFRSNKARALLAYLAVEAGRPHARESLAGLLWPLCPDAVALSGLRNTLSNLRHLLGDQTPMPEKPAGAFLLTNRATVQLNPAADIRLDTDTLSSLMSGRPALDAVEQAVSLCRGTFMEGFSLDGCEAFDEWLLFQRERFGREAATALRELIAAYMAAGRYAEAASTARRYLALDAWDEAVHRRLMGSLALAGQRGAAMAHYEECRRLLATELGVDPERETTELYEQIRSGIPQPEPQHAREPLALFSSFVARDRELAYLGNHLAEAKSGRGRVVFVTGQAGSGKTTLINEFARRAMGGQRDIVVAGGTCSAIGGMGDPHLPFREIARMLTGDIDVHRAGCAITPEHAQRLWSVVPEAGQALAEHAIDLVDRFVPGDELLLRLDAAMPAPARLAAPAWRALLADRVRRRPAPGPLSQTNLFEQLTAFLCALARRRPLILLVDDLQWADAGTTSLLFHIGRRLAGHRILIVGAYRSDEVAHASDGARHPLAAIIREFQREFGDILLHLDQSDGRTFIDALLDATPNQLSSDFRATLYRHTEGHPLFTVELLRGLQEREKLICDASGRWTEGAAPTWDHLPARVEAVIAERIARLPSDAQNMLRAASVEGEQFTAEVLARVHNSGNHEVIRRLSGALSTDYQIVCADSLQRTDGHSLSRYRFRHHLFWRYLYHQLDQLDRARLHGEIGAALEATHGPGDESLAEMAPRLAWHYEQAGDPDKAVHYWQKAGDWAMRVAGSEQAIGYYMRGLAQLAGQPPSPRRSEQELRLQHAVYAQFFLTRGWGDRETAGMLARIYTQAHELGTDVTVAAAISDLAVAHMGEGKLDEAVELGKKLVRLAERDRNPLVLQVGYRILAETQGFRGELAEARRHAELALDLAASQPGVDARRLPADIAPESGCPSVLALTLLAQGYPDQAREWCEKAIAGARRSSSGVIRVFALIVGGILSAYVRRDTMLLRTYLQELVSLSTGKGWPSFAAWALVDQGLALTETGQVGAGLEALERGVAAWQATGSVSGAVFLWLLISDARRRAGQIDKGLAAIDHAISVAEQSGLRFFEAEAWRLRGELLACSDGSAASDAETCYVRALAIARRQTARFFELKAAVSLARLWQAQGKPAQALDLLAGVYGWFTEGHDTPDLMEARALLQELRT